MKIFDPHEISEYEYTFGSMDDIKISIIAYRNFNIEPYIKIYKMSDGKEYMCRLSLISSKYLGLLDENLALQYEDIYKIYKIVEESKFNIFSMFAHTIEESLDPYLSDDELDDILEQKYRISNRNFNSFKIPNYFSLLIFTVSKSISLGKNFINLYDLQQ